MKKTTLGIGITGSYCTFFKTKIIMKELIDAGYDLVPIISYAVKTTPTRFCDNKLFIEELETICSHKPIDSIVGAEPLGPSKLLDAMLILPCTGNTLAKLANGITDTPVTMAAKAHLRNLRPLIICVSTNDGLSGSFHNLAVLYNRKNIYIAPLLQDDPINKPNSLVVDFTQIEPSIRAALRNEQLQPLLSKGDH